MTTKEFSEKWWGLIPDAELAEWESDIKSLKAPTDLKMLNEASQVGFGQGMKFSDALWLEKIDKVVDKLKIIQTLGVTTACAYAIKELIRYLRTEK